MVGLIHVIASMQPGRKDQLRVRPSNDQLRKIGETTASQYNHKAQGRGLRWKGKQTIATPQLQQQVETKRKRGRPRKDQGIGTQESQTTEPAPPAPPVC